MVRQPVALGAWTPSGPQPWTGSTAAHYAAAFGHEPAIIHYYQDLVHKPDFDAPKMSEIVAGGAIPLVSWELDDYTGGVTQPAYSNLSFSRGDHDAALIAWLTSAATWGKPFVLRFFWEMNGGDYPWGYNHNGNSPGSFIDAWRYVAQLVYDHAHLAQNLWCPAIDFPVWNQLPFELLWPGDRFVDNVGLDGYNNPASQTHVPNGAWISFEDVIRPCLDRLLQMPHVPKPVILAEVGCHKTGGDRAAWIQDMGVSLQTMNVQALVWWNNVLGNGSLDCRLDGDAATLAAWRALVASPSMQGKILG